MEKPKQPRPTFPAPILVGSGSGGDRAVDFLLTALEMILREDDPGLLYPIQGEISNWIEELWEKPCQVTTSDVPTTTSKTVERDFLKESLALFADHRSEDENQIARLLSDISLDEVQRLSSALRSKDAAGIEAVRAEIFDKLGKRLADGLTPSRVSAFASIVARCRAGRAEALCLVLYKKHATVLIDRARHADVEAVLNLIRADRLFLSDSCTADVIRRAEFQNNRLFFKQLARAVTYRPHLGWKKGCRLYLYILFAMAVPLPSLAMLQLRVDPHGTRFKTFPAFEKFVERCREDFKVIQADVLGENKQEPKPGDV